jgi:hypothetical protein
VDAFAMEKPSFRTSLPRTWLFMVGTRKGSREPVEGSLGALVGTARWQAHAAR